MTFCVWSCGSFIPLDDITVAFQFTAVCFTPWNIERNIERLFFYCPMCFCFFESVSATATHLTNLVRLFSERKSVRLKACPDL